MTGVDYILATVVALSTIYGAIRGFLRESIALLAWLIGLWLAWRYESLLTPYLGGALEGTDLQVWVARGLLLLAALVTGSVVGSLLSYLVQRSGLSLGVDRILGAAFGVVRGAVIVGLLVMLGQAADLMHEPWWQKSRLMPYAAEMANVLRGYLETGRDFVEDTLEPA